MPDTSNPSCGCSPSSVIASFSARRTLKSPHPGHQTTSASESYLRVSSLDTNADLLGDGVCYILWREWPSVIFVDSARNAGAGLHPQQLGELRRVILLDDDSVPHAYQCVPYCLHGQRPEIAEGEYAGAHSPCV